jgi:hypothetical protein
MNAERSRREPLDPGEPVRGPGVLLFHADRDLGRPPLVREAACRTGQGRPVRGASDEPRGREPESPLDAAGL